MRRCFDIICLVVLEFTSRFLRASWQSALVGWAFRLQPKERRPAMVHGLAAIGDSVHTIARMTGLPASEVWRLLAKGQP